jgi:hypothetical protein
MIPSFDFFTFVPSVVLELSLARIICKGAHCALVVYSMSCGLGFVLFESLDKC